jgi:hypothetical protein
MSSYQRLDADEGFEWSGRAKLTIDHDAVLVTF